MLQVAVEHRFGQFALDVTFEAPGGITALFGPSGSGKTSVIRAVAGVLGCDRAQVVLDGERLSDLPAHKRGIGYVYQDGRLFPHLSVLQNLRYGGRVDEAAVIGFLGLEPLLNRRPAQLSGGEAQRVALGRALMCGPRLLLLDEPLSALDEPRKAEVMPYLEALRDGSDVPMLYVSHDLSEVARLARQVVVLDQGRVAVAGDVTQVLADPAAVRFVGPRAAGAVLSGRVVGHADDGLTKVETPAGALWLPGLVARAGAHIRVRIPAQDVILSRAAPQGLSALNVLRATVTTLDPGAAGVEVGLQAGEARLLARVTRRSATALELAPGQEVYAIAKATAIAPGDVVSPRDNRG